MKINVSARLAIFFFLFQLFFISCVHAESERLHLLGRSVVDGYRAILTESDQQWLKEKKIIRLGTSGPDYPPFDITATGHDYYEGITADYAKLLATLLHVQVEVRRYVTRADAIAALKLGEIDLLSTSNAFEAADADVVLSGPYADDQAVLVTRIDDSRHLDSELAGKRIAMVYYYLPSERVQAVYPKADLQLFPSALSAINAVAFGQADVFLGDAISANYLANEGQLSNVQLSNFVSFEVKKFAFALARDNARLLRLINTALAAIPATERVAILNRWSAGVSMPGLDRLQLSVGEQRWLSTHPKVRVLVNAGFMPLVFFDDEGVFQGITAELLEKISQRTGLVFDMQPGGSAQDMVAQVKIGKADMVGAFALDSELQGELSFTRPYLSSAFVLVARTERESPRSLEDLSGKRIALIRGIPIRETLQRAHPQVGLVETNTAADAMALLAQGKVEAVVTSLLVSRYMISNQYRGRLHIASALDTSPLQVAFATNKGAPELHSILEKALLSIPPEEIDALINRWRSDVVVGDGFWLKYRSVIIKGFAVAGLLLLIAFFWITYLRRLIRKRQQAEHALSEQLEFKSVLINGTPHPIYVCDREGNLLICNSAYLDTFGIERDAVIGKKVTDMRLFDPVEVQQYQADCLNVIESGQPVAQDRCLTLANHQTRTIFHWLLPYRDSDAAVTGIIGGWIDVSERQQLLDRLQVAKDEADEANRAKSVFLATMSHEIRTPMNAIIGMLELALKKADQQILDRFAIKVAADAAAGLLELIGDILDIARIESGRLSLAPERANLRALVESVVRIFDGLARQKGIQLILEVDLNASRDVLIDPLRLKQVLSNLLSNAIKFTHQGAVRVTLEGRTSEDGEHLHVRLLVADTGVGISAVDQLKLFAPFAQADNHGQSARSGSGLGLSISRTLCNMMGGELRLSSVLGEGCQVEMLLNMSLLAPLGLLPVAIEPVTEPQASALNILVVDDYPANRILLLQQLGYLGHRVTEAENGSDGLRVWRSGVFDVVITDCNMPIMNGYALARAIRLDELARGLSPCLLLGFTANAQPEEVARCIEAGMDDCMFKPIGLKGLSDRLVSFTRIETLVAAEVVPSSFANIDLGGLEALVGGDPKTIKKLLTELAVSNKEDLVRLSVLMADSNLQGLSDLAHRIKGGARIVKADYLIQVCERLEVLCEEGGVEQDLVASGHALRRAMLQLEDALASYSI